MEKKQRKPILVIGSLNMDLVASTARLPKEGETVFGRQFSTFPGGKGANQAAAAGMLGANVYMAGCIGRDGFGEALKNSLAEKGVDTRFVRTAKDATGTALITVAETGANTIVVVPGANDCCDRFDIDHALGSFSEPGILLLQHEIPEESVEYAIHRAREAGWVIILNPAPIRDIPAEIYSMVDLLTPNETEAAALAGFDIEVKEEAVAAGMKFLQKGIKQVVITLGEMGAVWLHGETAEFFSAYKVKAVDTTAAGDSYTAAIAVALAEGNSMPEALRFAAQTAAIAVTRSGAQSSLPSREEVAAFAKQQEGSLS